MTTPTDLTPTTTPYDLLGGREPVLALAEAFYDAMEQDEEALTLLHRQGEPGRIHPEVRQRFGLFLVGWLGGPNDYMERYGHPRLRRRHSHVPVDEAMRDAWLRAMGTALTQCNVQGDLRTYLDRRFAEVADFLRNVP